MTPLELKQAFRVLEARVKVLESEVTAIRNRVGSLEAKPEVTPAEVLEAVKQAHTPEKPKKLCPKCGKKPGYFFHVKNCSGP